MADAAGDFDLSRFWDEVARGDAAEAGPLDPETAAAIRRLHRLAAAPVPGQARERVWRRLMATEAPRGIAADASSTFPAVSLNGRSAEAHAPARSQRLALPHQAPTGVFARVGLAALLL